MYRIRVKFVLAWFPSIYLQKVSARGLFDTRL